MREKRSTVTLSPVNNCARCGESHEELVFEKLDREITFPSEIVTHWALCPVSAQPILYGMVATQELNQIRTRLDEVEGAVERINDDLHLAGIG